MLYVNSRDDSDGFIQAMKFELHLNKYIFHFKFSLFFCCITTIFIKLIITLYTQSGKIRFSTKLQRLAGREIDFYPFLVWKSP